MKVLPLAVGILAASLATASTVLYLQARREAFDLQATLSTTRASLTAEEKARAAAQTALGEANSRLLSLDRELIDTRAKLASAIAQVSEIDQNLGKVRNTLALRDENERLLNREIATLNKNIEATGRRLAEMDGLRARINALEQQIALGGAKVGTDGLPLAAVETSGRSIVALGPQDSFIVINLGTKGGAAKGRRVHIRQGTELVGTALISDALAELSIAQVDPQALRAVLRIGDGIILAQ